MSPRVTDQYRQLGLELKVLFKALRMEASRQQLLDDALNAAEAYMELGFRLDVDPDEMALLLDLKDRLESQLTPQQEAALGAAEEGPS